MRSGEILASIVRASAAATLKDPNSTSLTQKGIIEHGMAQMSQKFRDMGKQVYVGRTR